MIHVVLIDKASSSYSGVGDSIWVITYIYSWVTVRLGHTLLFRKLKGFLFENTAVTCRNFNIFRKLMYLKSVFSIVIGNFLLEDLAKPRCRRHRKTRLPARGPKILNMVVLIKVLVIHNMNRFVSSHLLSVDFIPPNVDKYKYAYRNSTSYKENQFVIGTSYTS